MWRFKLETNNGDLSRAGAALPIRICDALNQGCGLSLGVLPCLQAAEAPPQCACELISSSAHLPDLKLVNTRVCTRRMSCGKASGGVRRFLSASLKKMVLLSATSFFTNFTDAAFGLA